MKAWLILVFIFFKIIVPTVAQEEKQKVSHINKGDTFLNLAFQISNKNQINDSFYQIRGVKLGAGYYFLKKLAIKGTLTGQHYLVQELVIPTSKEFNKKNLVLIDGQLRYNFWEANGFVTTFLQTGYGFGKFYDLDKIHIKRWEILTLGETLYMPGLNLNKLGFEVAVGMEKDNLSKKIAYPMFLGLSYYFGNSTQ